MNLLFLIELNLILFLIFFSFFSSCGKSKLLTSAIAIEEALIGIICKMYSTAACFCNQIKCYC